MNWELIKQASSRKVLLFRMEVPNGWLIRSASCIKKRISLHDFSNLSISESIIFIEDRKNEWLIDEQANWKLLSKKTKDFGGALTSKTFRLQVPGGWIVKTQTENKAISVTGSSLIEAMIFVDDKERLWN